MRNVFKKLSGFISNKMPAVLRNRARKRPRTRADSKSAPIPSPKKADHFSVADQRLSKTLAGHSSGVTVKKTAPMVRGSGEERLTQVFKNYFNDPKMYKAGDGPDNVLNLLKNLEIQAPNLNLDEARALVIFRRPNPSEDSDRQTTDLVHTNFRTLHMTDCLFHVVLEYQGLIFDSSFGEVPAVMPARDYFRGMYYEGNGQNVNWDNYRFEISPARQRALIRKMGRYRFKTPEEMMWAVQVRAVPARLYLEKYHQELRRSIGSPRRIRKEHEQFVPSQPLYRYLGEAKGTREYFQPFPQKFEVKYPDGTVVWSDSQAFELSETQEVVNAVNIRRRDGTNSGYNRTNRGGLELSGFYPAHMLDLDNLRGRTVVDMSVGEGLWVEELRDGGVNAFGVDAILSPRQLAMRYEGVRNSGMFIQALVHNTGIKSNQADYIYETYGLFDYDLYLENKADLRTATLREWHRILKVGGRIRIAPSDLTDRDHWQSVVAPMKGLLRLAEPEYVNRERDPARVVVEIEKVK